METLSLMIHVTAAAVLVGPQVLMFYAVIPSSWLIDDERLKRDLLAVVARRFGALAGLALITLLVTGLYQFYSVTPDFIREDINAYRYGQIFMIHVSSLTILGPVVSRLTIMSGARIIPGRRNRLVHQIASQHYRLDSAPSSVSLRRSRIRAIERRRHLCNNPTRMQS